MKYFFVIFFIIYYSFVNAQTIIVSDGHSVSCILPESICLITDTKNNSDRHYIGSKVQIITSSYAFNGAWFTGGIAKPVGTGDEFVINDFKLKVLSQPSLPTYPSCQPGAETPVNSFGFGSGVSIKIIAIGPLDKTRYADAGKYNGEVYQTFGNITPIGGCWYSGIIEKGNKIFLFPCMQIMKYEANGNTVVLPVLPKQPDKPKLVVTNKPVNKVLKGKFKDQRDGGETYQTIKIGTQIWMSQNLNESNFRNGDKIKEAKTGAEWEKAGKEKQPAWCYYNDDAKNKKFGKLYNWYAVNDPRGLASKGWHIPSTIETTTLITYLGGDRKAHIAMKSTGGWIADVSGSNQSGFDGIAAGYCIYNGDFGGIGSSGCWWNSTAEDKVSGYAEYFTIYFQKDKSTDWNIRNSRIDKSSGLSVRCVKN